MAAPSAEPPPGSDDEDEVEYIGVPSTYRASSTSYFFDPSTMGEDATPVPYTQKNIEPKYTRGMENEPGGWGEERIVKLQSEMVDAGVLKPGSYQRGYWDIASINAYEKLLATSNTAGLSVDQTLSNYRQVIAKYGKPGDAETPRQPFILQKRDPEALRALLGAVSGRIMGGSLSPEEEDKFITTFNTMSEEAQRAAYTASGSGGPGGPGGIDQEIDPEAQAAKFLRDTRPKDVIRHDVIERFDQFQSLLNKYQ